MSDIGSPRTEGSTDGTSATNRLRLVWLLPSVILGVLASVGVEVLTHSGGPPLGSGSVESIIRHLLPSAAVGVCVGFVAWLLAFLVWRVLAGTVVGIIVGLLAAYVFASGSHPDTGSEFGDAATTLGGAALGAGLCLVAGLVVGIRAHRRSRRALSPWRPRPAGSFTDSTRGQPGSGQRST